MNLPIPSQLPLQMAHARLLPSIVDHEEGVDHPWQPAKEPEQQAHQEGSWTAGQQNGQGRQEEAKQVLHGVEEGFLGYRKKWLLDFLVSLVNKSSVYR